MPELYFVTFYVQSLIVYIVEAAILYQVSSPRSLSLHFQAVHKVRRLDQGEWNLTSKHIMPSETLLWKSLTHKQQDHHTNIRSTAVAEPQVISAEYQSNPS